MARSSALACAAPATDAESESLTAFKTALLVLLTANTIYFAVFGTPSKAVDAGAWLVLLLLFDAETTFNAALSSARAQLALGATRLLAAAAVIGASIGYVFEDDTLDAVNAALWIFVVILLEAEVRWPAVVARHRVAFNTSAAALFGSLTLLVLTWAAYGMWLDAYDAVLWLIAFAIIEVNLVKLERAPPLVSGGVEDAG